MTKMNLTIASYMAIREEQQTGIRRLAEVGRRIRKALKLAPGCPPEGRGIAAHEEHSERLGRPGEIQDVARIQEPENLKGRSQSVKTHKGGLQTASLPRTVRQGAGQACPGARLDDRGAAAGRRTE